MAGELTSDSIEAVVVHSDLRRTGFFECSDPMLNQLHSNVVCGLRGNFLDRPVGPGVPVRGLAGPAGAAGRAVQGKGPGVVATACLHRTARILAQAAALTGHQRDAAEFTTLAEQTRAAFN